MNKQSIIVAVDGPSASGKSTVSRRTAQAVGFIYVDSGALYRGITWKCVKEGIDVKDTQAVTDLLIRMNMELVLRDNAVGYLIDGEDPGQEIRAEPVRERVADIAAQQVARVYIVAKLRLMTKFGHLVMEGRDIGTVVFPDTPYKIYVTADESVRAARRVDMGEIDSVASRDKADSARATAPLRVADGAVVLDTSDHTIETGVRAALDILHGQGLPAATT